MDGRSVGRVALVLAAMLAGCSHPDNGLSKKDYDDLVNRQPPAAATQPKEAPPIPDLQPILAAPPPPSVAQRLVTVAVTDPSIPVRDVLLELARKVGVDIDIDPNIAGGIILTAKDRPFLDVIDRICEQANLRYTYKDNVLKVEVDTMYHQTYHLDLLNTVRTSSTDIATSTDVNNSIQGAGAPTGNNASTSDVKSTSTSDPWKEVEDNIKQILVNSNPQNQPITSNLSGGVAVGDGGGAVLAGGGSRRAAGQPLLGSQTSYQQASAPNDNTPGVAGAGSAPGAGTGNAGSDPSQAAANYAAQTGAAIANGGEAPKTAPAVALPAGLGRAAAAPTTQQAQYSINKQAGVVSVFGTSRQHKLVKSYLDKVIAKAGAQVLIEAKVVEVRLNNQYNTGIDWTALRQNLRGTGGGLSGYNAGTTAPGSSNSFVGTPGALASPFGQLGGLNIGFTTFGGDLAGMINMIQQFGTTRTLSSPRLTVMNNHTAMLKVAENYVYFKLLATVTATPAAVGTPASQTATYTSTLQTLPIGLVMSVQPSIDLEKNEVTLGLRPTVTAQAAAPVPDPAVQLSIAAACGSQTTGACSPNNVATAVASASVPVVDVREMESVVTVPSGAVVVMGGLMQESVDKQDSGIPGAGDVPVVGNLFKANSDQTQMTELVIFLRATVVHGSDTVDAADKDIYKRYMHDPRPLGF